MGGGSSPKSGQGQPGKPGEGNSPEQGGGGDPQARERTPEAPGEKGQQPGEEQGGEQPKPSDQQGGDPKSPRESNGDPRNEKGGPPPALETGRASQDRSNERWGDLPETVRDLFRTEGGGELPPEYRDWIDAYYRRLNRERR